MDMDGTSLTKRAIGYLAAAAVAIGLAGASVSACDLTEPSHLRQDSTRERDSSKGTASLTAEELDVAQGDLLRRLGTADRG